MVFSSRFSALLFTPMWLLACWPQFVLAASQTCEASSGLRVTPLLELYTSEGCSSCPPADTWLSQLRTTTPAVNLLAFHVDYWDGLGWKDRFAQAAFSDKQRQQSRLAGQSSVYTPQWTLNGYDFRGWGDTRLQRALKVLADTPPVVNIAMRQLQQEGTPALSIQVKPTGLAQDAALFVAIYTDGLQSTVAAGENRGRQLQHDAVVQRWLGPFPVNNQQETVRRVALDGLPQDKAQGAVAYVQSVKTGEVLQSVKLAFCRP